MMFHCWDLDAGHTRDDASDIDAPDERDAAELYAEARFTGSDPFNSIDVRVVAWGSEASSEVDVTVTVEAVPHFSGSRPKRVAESGR